MRGAEALCMLLEGSTRGVRLLWGTGSRKTVLPTMVLFLFNELVFEVLDVDLCRKKPLTCCIDLMSEVHVPTCKTPSQ